MLTYRLALIGFGNVGQGMAQILRDKGDFLAEHFDVRFEIVAISDLLKGSVYGPEGLDPNVLLTALETDSDLHNVPAVVSGWDAYTTIERSKADVLVELSYTDLQTGEPAFSHIRKALEMGMDVVTTNKGPVALYYPELVALARESGAKIGVEGTVMSGTPALHLGKDLLAGAGIQRIQGILNGTTNFILMKMESGASYEAALAEAQALGYAEADPTGDVEGYDAAGKIVILSNVLMSTPIIMDDVQRTGIIGLTRQQVVEASASGNRWKLIGSLERTASGVMASVKPTLLPLDHPLASVNGATNAITYTTDLLGDVTLVGPGAGRQETGYALICDLLSIARSHSH